VTIGGKPVHIGGMCKGSGMIHPNMATMLGVVTCDADVEPEVWRGMLRRACDASFNAVSDSICCCCRTAAECMAKLPGLISSCRLQMQSAIVGVVACDASVDLKCGGACCTGHAMQALTQYVLELQEQQQIS
jgi:hypothetical protein